MNYQKEKLRKQFHLLLQQKEKTKVPQNKFNQEDRRPVLGKLQNTEERNRGRYKYVEAHTMFMDWKN